MCLLLLFCLLGTLAAGYGMIALVVIATSPVKHIPSCHCTLAPECWDPSGCSESGLLELALWSRTKTSTSTDESAFPRTAQPRAKD